MQTENKTLLCHYQYDPLDRLVDCTYSGEEGARRFCQKDRLATETDGFVHRSIIQHENQLLAQQNRQSEVVETRLLATDQRRTVLNVLDAPGPHLIAHTPYGHRPLASGLLSLLGFNGERPDPVTGCYLLGNGHRAFNPVLMRFNRPDSWSPFGRGGFNAYAYCAGDPVNQTDSTGRFSIFPKGYNPIKSIENLVGLRAPSGRKNRPRNGSTPTTSQTPSTAGASAENKTNNSIIVSQQKTIELQQRTIASQQKNLDSAENTIQLGKLVVSDYQRIIKQQQYLIGEQQILIADLKEDLLFLYPSTLTAPELQKILHAPTAHILPRREAGESNLAIVRAKILLSAIRNTARINIGKLKEGQPRLALFTTA